MESEGSLTCTQESATGPYLERVQSNSHPISLGYILIYYPPICCLELPSGLFHSGFPITNLFTFPFKKQEVVSQEKKEAGCVHVILLLNDSKLGQASW
jgi:hypothetical protein